MDKKLQEEHWCDHVPTLVWPCADTGVTMCQHWCDHVPKAVETIHEGNATALLNLQEKSDRTIPNNKPNIINHNNE